MKIVDLRTTTVSIPLEAPLRHAIGTHWDRFIRTIVEVVCDTGVVGLGEKGGGGASAEEAFPVDREIEVYRALAAPFPQDRLRIDPNSVWSVEQAIHVGRAIIDRNNDYFEDPCWGPEGMRRLRQFAPVPTATNAVVVNFEHRAQSIRQNLIDVILLDTTFWGGLRQAYKAGTVLETFQYGGSVHFIRRTGRSTRLDAASGCRPAQYRFCG